MIKENSGKIYLFPLDFNLGFAYAKLIDFSDVTGFEGKMLISYNKIEINKVKIPTLDEIDKYGIMFGPVSVFKYPNPKGKGDWIYLGQSNNYPKQYPTFKDVRANFGVKDWTKIGPWFKRELNLEDCVDVDSYEQVRYLEMPTILSQKQIQQRATMDYLISQSMKVSDYYDLNNFKNWLLYIILVNTSYSKEKAYLLLRDLPSQPLYEN
jgi:hypothetical protein